MRRAQSIEQDRLTRSGGYEEKRRYIPLYMDFCIKKEMFSKAKSQSIQERELVFNLPLFNLEADRKRESLATSMNMNVRPESKDVVNVP